MTTPTTVQVQIQLRADTAANWTAQNPTLLNNELALETDTKKLKVGNGSTAWNSLAYFPSIVTGGTVLGNLEIGTTGTLTFEGSTADGFETTLGVINPSADRTINLPNQSGTVVVSGNASIVDADIAANAEIAVSKLADGAARQLLQTDAAGTGVEWTSNVDVPGTLDVTGAATFDAAVTIAGDLTVNGTTTNINTQNLVVEDKNIILADVASPTDVTADGGGITLKGATDKTITWSDTTDSWEFNQPTITTGSSTAASFIPTSSTVPSNGVYIPASNSVAISTNGTERLRITSDGRLGLGTSSPTSILHCNYATATDTYIRTTNSAGTNGFDFGVSSGGEAWVFNRNNSNMYLGTNSAQRVTITADGNVGIGTTAPTAALAFGNVVDTNGYDVSRIRLYDNLSGAIAGFGVSASQLNYRTLEAHVWYDGTSEKARIDSSGRLLVGTSSDSGGALFQVNGDRIRIGTAKTPASASATGATGEICWDASYIYVCTATNTWKRAALATW